MSESAALTLEPTGDRDHDRVGLRAALRSIGTRDGIDIFLQYLPLVAVTFLAKFSVPPLGPMGLGLDVPLLLGAAIAGLLLGRFHVQLGRLALYALMVGWLAGVQLLRGDAFSAASIAMLMALFLPLTLQLGRQAVPGPLRPSPVRAGLAAAATPLDAALDAFATVAVFFAVCGLLQYLLQALIGATWSYPIEHGLPKALQIQKFNTLIPVEQGGSVLKSNGVFFLEPSFFSQFMALGLLTELSRHRRLLRMALLLGALAVSFSGTGLIVLSVGLVGWMIAGRRWGFALLGVFVAVGLALVAGLLVDSLPFKPLLGRAAEFQSSHSSGSARFVAWLDLFDRQWWTDPWRVLFGTGAGSFAAYSLTARMPTAEMSFSKMLFEFGLSGAVLFFGFLTYAIHSVPAPLALRLGLTATLLVNGAYVAFPVGIAASILLWPAAAGRTPARPPGARVNRHLTDRPIHESKDTTL